MNARTTTASFLVMAACSLAFAEGNPGSSPVGVPPVGAVAARAAAMAKAWLIDETESAAIVQDLKAKAQQCVAKEQFGTAEVLLRAVLQIREKASGADNPDLVEDLLALAQLYDSAGLYPMGSMLYVLHRPQDPQFAGKNSEAVAVAKRVLALREKALGPAHPDVALFSAWVASLQHALGNLQEAEGLYRRSLTIREKAFSADDPPVAATLIPLVALYCAQGKHDEAESLFKRALEIQKRTPQDSMVSGSIQSLVVYFKETEMNKESALLKQWMEQN